MLKLSNKINYKKINQYRIYINKKMIFLKKKVFCEMHTLFLSNYLFRNEENYIATLKY